MPDDTMPINHSPSLTLVLETPKVASTPTTPPSKTPSGAETGTLSDEVLQLQGETSRAIGQLLMTRVSMDTHCRKQVSDTEAAFCENEAQATEAIREVKPHCAAAIREVEATCADHACAIQQLHSDSMQGLEREAIEEEGRDCQSFLANCGAALQACPQKPKGY